MYACRPVLCKQRRGMGETHASSDFELPTPERGNLNKWNAACKI